MKQVALLALLLVPASPAVAGGASSFTLVNGTSGALSDVSIRRAGTNDWKPLGAAPAAGARGAVKFSDPDCAFDIRANVGGGGAGHRALGEIFGELAMPGAGGFGHCALRGHSLFDRATAIITLVRFHRSPLAPNEDNQKTFAPELLRDR